MGSDSNSTASRSQTPDRKRKRHKASKEPKAKRGHKADKSRQKHRKSAKRGRLDDADAEHELLMHAAMGSSKALHKFLDAHPSLDLNAFDATGATALHHACRQGHLQAAELLLRYAREPAPRQSQASPRLHATSASHCSRHAGGLPGAAHHEAWTNILQRTWLARGARRRGADIDAEDFAGDSAAHMAATHGHLKLLTALLQVRVPGMCAALARSWHAASRAATQPSCRHQCGSQLAGQRDMHGRSRGLLGLSRTCFCSSPLSSGLVTGLIRLAVLCCLLWRLSLRLPRAQAQPAPHIERRNARGVSVRQLTESVMGQRDLRSW